MLSLAGLIAKGIGAVYRIPLTGLLGGYQLGLYQMAYPLFCVLLTFSSAGIPNALSRMVATEKGDVMHGALTLFSLLGLAGGAAMLLLAPFMSGLQGEKSLISCYFSLAPSVFFVALIAVLRGYFQGKNDMRPTALSEIIEQLVKAGAGLALSGLVPVHRRASFALLAVTLSEAVALCYLAWLYRRERRGLLVRERRGGSVLRSALPVMAAAALLPLSRMVDSVLIVRRLNVFTDRAVAMYGLFSGAAASLCALPATLCYGLVAAIVPLVSESAKRGDGEEGSARAMYALLLTLLLSLPFALLLLFFAPYIVNFLYPSLSLSDRGTLCALVRMLSISSVFLAGVDTLSASLTGLGRAKKAALSMGIAVTVKTILELLLINGRFLIVGAAAAANLCYPIAFFLDLMYTVRKNKEKAYDHGHRLGNGAGGVDPQRPQGTAGGRRGGPSYRRDPRGAEP